ncbi:SRPBCC family protein [Microbispora hainanensis]|uniref:SRPBCC family protein n=1 Tax=Microbispora hainanensis TaxID=568844 RepID=A0ABZ1SL68_9ACTN|nr:MULTISPECIES: SRPBCC family protein [Microbispora]
MNATLGMYEGQAALRMERRLAHPREKVWRALTEPDRLGQWFPFKVVEMDLRVGGKIAFDGGGMTMDAEITELDPPRLFAFLQHAPREMPREGDNILRFELLPDEGGCLLVFTQVFQDRPAAASYASGWQVCLDAMDAIVGGRPAQWPAGNFAHLHEAYVEALGLAEGTAERLDESLGDQAGGGWRVRFERQLTRPVEEVWTAAGAPAATPGAPVPGGIGEGIVTAVREPAAGLPAYVESGEPGRRVRWELSQGTGHGARLVVTETGLPDPDGPLRAWRDRIEALARGLLA